MTNTRRGQGRNGAVHLTAALLAAFAASGCASTHDALDTAVTGVKIGVTTAFEETKGAIAKLAKYTKIADLLKKNHDSVNNDDGEIVKVIDAGDDTRKKPSGKAQPKKSAGRPHQERAETRLPKTAPRQQTLPTGSFKGAFGWPVEAGIISSEFGPRWGRTHRGIDIAAETGEPILAAADGEVIYSGNGLRGYGNVVILRHDAHTTTLYAHNSALQCRAGERVKAGATIALLGSTGHSTGPHCHFEVRDDREAINPRTRLVKSRIFEQQILLADGTRRRG